MDIWIFRRVMVFCFGVCVMGAEAWGAGTSRSAVRAPAAKANAGSVVKPGAVKGAAKSAKRAKAASKPVGRSSSLKTKPVDSKASDVKAKASDECNEVCMELVSRALLDAARDLYRLGHKRLAWEYVKRITLKFRKTSAGAVAEQLSERWHQELLSQIDQSGRIEFIVFTSLYGMGLGGLMPAVFNFSGASIQPYVFGVSLLAFTAVSLTSSILLTAKYEMPEGMASLTWNATLWGAWNLGAISIIAGMGGYDGLDNVRMAVLGSAIGYGVGLVVGKFARPTPGASLLAGSLGAWMLGYTGAIIGLAQIYRAYIQSRATVAALLVTSDIGFIGGFFLQNQLKLSRSRMMLLNLGGIVGAGTGIGIGLLVLLALPGNDAAAFMFVSSMILAGGGIALTYFLTQGMPGEKSKEPLVSGALLNLHKGRWRWDVPVPLVAPEVDPGVPSQVGIKVMVPLAMGTW